LLERPPADEAVQLSLKMPKELIDDGGTGEKNDPSLQKTVIDFHQEMRDKLGTESYNKLKRERFFEKNNWDTIKRLVDDMKFNPSEWSGLNYLNNENVDNWEYFLYKVLKIAKIGPYCELVEFIKISSLSWECKSISLSSILINPDNCIFLEIILGSPYSSSKYTFFG
jgi:hypothetical protein